MTLTYPPLPEPYATALQGAVSHALTRTRPIGIVACGSVIRGQPDATSDLDVYVIHEAPWRQRVQRWFNGVPCEMFINPPRAIEQYFHEEHAHGRPLTAHMLTTGVVMLNTSPRVDELLTQARVRLGEQPAYAAFHVTMTRYSASTAFEDAGDVAGRDPATASMLLDKAVITALESFFISRQLLIPRHKELLKTVQALDSVAGQAAGAYFTAATWPDKLSAAATLFDHVIGAHGFFEWESAPEPV